MKCTRNVTDHVIWVGANDRRLNLFENLFPIPRGVSYNAYLIKDEKNALMDTVDASASEQFIENVTYALNGGKLDYLVVQHMEPDHCANIQRILELYPETKVVGNVKTMQMISQFFDADLEGRQVVVKEGDTTATNHSGGIQGGISNGQDIYFRVAFKPVATILKEQEELFVNIKKNYQYIRMSIGVSRIY